MILPSEKSATDVAAQCFLNALIRETKDWQLAEYPPDELIIPLDEQKSLHFRVAYFSPTQHHRFAFPAHLVTGHCCKVSDEAAFCLIQRPYISKTLLTRRISPRGSP